MSCQVGSIVQAVFSLIGIASVVVMSLLMRRAVRVNRELRGEIRTWQSRYARACSRELNLMDAIIYARLPPEPPKAAP